MVYKVSKGGVRSGNTLRGLHTLRTRRYAGQACIIGQSNLSRKQIDHLIDGNSEDSIVSDTLKNTDVVLSLNKKQRWRLPLAVRQMIRAGHFSKSEATVSVLERHKLKRRANCVGFACSKQTNGSGQDIKGNELSEDVHGQKRYFSFNINSFEGEESRRQWKKRMAELKIKMAREKKNKEKKDQRKDMKSVEVLTIEGGRINSQAIKKPLSSNKPGYTLEVFYPCPQSCSLTFNPKYTDVVMTHNDDGEMEVRSNVRNDKKSQRKHRRKMTGVDISAINAETKRCDKDVEEMWQEQYQDTCLHDSKGNQLTAPEPDRLNGITCADGLDRPRLNYDLSDSILTCWIDQAERAKAMWTNSSFKTRHRRRSAHDEDCKSLRTDSLSARDCKAHIVQIKKEHEKPANKGEPKKTMKNKSDAVQNLDESKPGLSLSSASVVLSSLEASPDNLRSRFGQLYSEAKCLPRRFCINMTDDVTNLLSPYRSARTSAAYTTFVVFTRRGIYDQGMETYDVTVNCAECFEPEKITHSLPYGPTTLESVINTFAGNLLDLKEAGYFTMSNISNNFTQTEPATAYAPPLEMIMEKMKIEVDSYFTSEKLNWVNLSGNGTSEAGNEKDDFSQSLLELAADCERDTFCDICYDNINPTQLDAASGTQLNLCGHLFCDACWRTHLRTRLREGAVHMTCPGYQCDTKLEPSTLLSLLHVTEVIQILRRALEEEVESCPTAKWCPNSSCGRVIRLRTKSSIKSIKLEDDSSQASHGDMLNLDINCSCGESWCFNCLSASHWPAQCDQAQDYLNKLSTLKPMNESCEEEEEAKIKLKPKCRPVESIEVEGRLCPRCGKFIQKNGGCPHMMCKCGFEFCWGCMSPWRGHPSTCRPDAATIYKYSRRLKVRHLSAPLNFDVAEGGEGNKKEPEPLKLPSGRQKASMYQRALQQRADEGKDKSWLKPAEELAFRICKAAGKDLQFKREVLLQCGVPESAIPALPADDDDSAEDCKLLRMPVADHVMRYLRSVREARIALHHVTEYTFVLLQNVPNSLDKRRVMRVASDLTAFCSFSLSVLHAGGNQDPRVALRRLADIRTWCSRTLDSLLAAVRRLQG